MNIQNHILSEARQVPSPNFNERPETCEPELVVVHCISLPPGQFGGPFIEQFFQNQLDPSGHPYFAEIAQMEVSSHLLIRRDGEIIQFVPFNRRAWHAGKSCYEGRENCNDFSIGIELEGSDDVPFEEVQYQVLERLVEVLQKTYPITECVGHQDIALPRGRKTDPGPHFEWARLDRFGPIGTRLA